MNTNKTHLVAYILIVCGSYHVIAQEPCLSRLNPQKGTCLPVRDCVPPRQIIEKGARIPQTCRINSADFKICCFEAETDLARKHVQMCKEYGKEVTKILGGNCFKFQQKLIVVGGGIRADPQEFPHMVAVGYENQSNEKVYICGGSLISRNFVLTAAHCLNSRNYGPPKTIRIGDLILNSDSDDAQPQEINISKIHRYPDYKPPAKYNDIALLELEREVNFTRYAYPACLPDKEDIADFKVVKATGWGNTNAWGDKSDQLMKVDINVYPHSNCSHFFQSMDRKLPNGISNVTHVCAGSVHDRKDTCEGDSGGPLQTPSRKFCTYDILGLTSFGKPCLLTTAPGVYTKVFPYIDWIETIVWP